LSTVERKAIQENEVEPLPEDLFDDLSDEDDQAAGLSVSVFNRSPNWTSRSVDYILHTFPLETMLQYFVLDSLGAEVGYNVKSRNNRGGVCTPHHQFQLLRLFLPLSG
jgi:hypothetical protein